MTTARLRASVREQRTLDASERKAMWALFQRYYTDVDSKRFASDLVRQERVILLHDATRTLRGFTSVSVTNDLVDGRPVRLVHTGDTVVDRRFWGQSALQRAFFWMLVREKLAHPFTALCWFALVKGYKGYLLATRHFPNHFPRARPNAASNTLRRLVDHVAKRRFGKTYDKLFGTLRSSTRLGRVRSGVAPISVRELGDRDVRFFLQKNPGHDQGDELCCVAAADAAFFSSFAVKMLRAMWRAPQRFVVETLPQNAATRRAKAGAQSARTGIVNVASRRA